MVSEKKTFWFHCGRCGSLFQSQAGDLENRLCQKCGFDPSIRHLESTPAAATPAPETGDSSESTTPTPETRGKKTGKKRKNRYFMIKLVAVWLLVLGMIILVARKMYHQNESPNPAANVTGITAPIDTEDDLAVHNKAYAKSAEAFMGFLAAGTPEERNQYVIDPIDTASRMARFYRLNPLISIDPKTVKPVDSEVLALPNGKAFESYWTTEDDRKLDAVFREDNGEWRLDWDHFVRFSTYPWALFLAGSGPPEGEFRLLMRERLANERKDSDALSVVLYAPRFGIPGETGYQSPEFVVSRNSNDGALLDAAFKMVRKGKRVYGAKLPNLAPEGMIQVRVKVRRSDVELDRKFEITEVLACHWYSVDDPGVEPSAPAPQAAPAPEEVKPQER
jgi:hypothetical protein